jgi:hypothetical protein
MKSERVTAFTTIERGQDHLDNSLQHRSDLVAST